MTVPVRDEIIRIGARGDGVSASGRYRAGSVPGDWIDGDGTLHAGPNRQDAPCPHYGQCGGCQLQHVADVALRSFYVDRVHHALAAHGLEAREICPPLMSPPHTRRRAALRAQRRGPKVRLGYQAAGSHQLVDIVQCTVLDPALAALLAPLRQLLLRLMGPRGDAHVHLTLIDGGTDVLLSGVEALGLDAHDAIMAFCTEQNIARFAIDAGDGPEDRWAPSPARVTLGGVAVPFPHAAFLQATRDGEAALVAAVRRIVGNATVVADLFCGIGTFALSLNAEVNVYAAEAGRDAIGALRSAANSTQRHVACEHRDLYRRPLTPAELARSDAVILDPPRAGAQDQIAELANAPVARVAYVSCNPTSFARDAAVLIGGGYRLDWVQPVAQFRWSTHLELAAQFSR